MTTKETIQTSINSRLKSTPTLIEGGTIQDIVGSVSYELANIIDTKIDVILDNAFVTTADEAHLLIKGEELGIYKKEATLAYVDATITNGEANVVINKGTRAKTSLGVVFETIADNTTDESGMAYVKMVCLNVGEIGNIEKNTLIEFDGSYIGLENAKITNQNEGYGGYEAEATEEYRERILEYLKDDACNSNISDYTMWAKSISGVKNVVIEDAISAGAGNVNVYISAVNNERVSSELINAVLEKIKKEQIINADVKVCALEYLPINIQATLSIKNEFNLMGVKEEFLNLLNKYLNTKPAIISYLYISNLFFEIEGILDVSNYLLNGATESIKVGTFEVPTTGLIELNVEEG